MTLQLLGTAGCHLCEQAEELLLPISLQCGKPLTLIDIADGDQAEILVARYGLRIPVLRCGERELDWPFDAMAATRFVNEAQD